MAADSADAAGGAVTGNGWIDVRERLPDAGVAGWCSDWCWVTEGESVWVSIWRVADRRWDRIDHCPGCECDGSDHWNVASWMPVVTPELAP